MKFLLLVDWTVDCAGHQYVFVCDVLIGRSCECMPCDREPPVKNEGSLLRFDSTVDVAANPTKYAVYADYSVLVRYLIEFKKREPRLQTGIFKQVSRPKPGFSGLKNGRVTQVPRFGETPV